MATKIGPEEYHALARLYGFHLSGIADAAPLKDINRYQAWIDSGFAGEMRYLTDHRAQKRHDPRSLLPAARTVLCLGMLYNGPAAHTAEFADYERGWISRYAWGEDYHHLIRGRLEQLVASLLEIEPFEYKICCDTAPLLERSYARAAGLGWIGRNTCLIHEGAGSWFFLGELLTSLDLPAGLPPPDRCGTCHRCIDACPTQAIVPAGDAWNIDSRQCISYLTIEKRGDIPDDQRPGLGSHIFGCDICQDVCPWNRKAPVTSEPEFQPAHLAPRLDALAQLSEEQFRTMFRDTPVDRARYTGFLRNVVVAMGNSGNADFREPLTRLSESPDGVVAGHAQWALQQLKAAR